MTSLPSYIKKFGLKTASQKIKKTVMEIKPLSSYTNDPDFKTYSSKLIKNKTINYSYILLFDSQFTIVGYGKTDESMLFKLPADPTQPTYTDSKPIRASVSDKYCIYGDFSSTKYYCRVTDYLSKAISKKVDAAHFANGMHFAFKLDMGADEYMVIHKFVKTGKSLYAMQKNLSVNSEYKTKYSEAELAILKHMYKTEQKYSPYCNKTKKTGASKKSGTSKKSKTEKK